MKNNEVAEHIVRKYFEIFFSSKVNFDELRNLLKEDFSFIGPLMEASSADEYVEKLKAIGVGDLKANIIGLFANDKEAAVLYELITPIGNHPTVEWFWIRNNKISAIRLLNDPRPFLSSFNNA